MRAPTIAKTNTQYHMSDNDVVLGERLDQYVLRVKDLPNEQKPREKLTELGPKSLTVAELMAAILGVGTRKEEVLAMAQRIIKEYGEKPITSEVNPRKMSDALNIPLSKSCQIIAAFELGQRFFANHNGRPVHIRNAKQAYLYLREMGISQKEQLRGLYLNSRYQVIYDEVISVGSLTANIVHPREVFKPAIERGAVAIIIAHNHPSGSLKPTTEDIKVTQQLRTAAHVLGIDLLDHLIITADKYVSIIERDS